MQYKNLCSELGRNGMSRAQLFRAIKEMSPDLKITYQTLSRYLNGESDLPYGVASLIAKILDKKVDYLFAEEET